MDETRKPHVIQMEPTTIVGTVPPSGEIIVGGTPRRCATKVVTWRERPELSFPGLKHRQETRAILLHHSAGEGDAAQMHRTLVSRKLSAHFHVDHLGLVTQYADTEARCAHAGSANGWSVGIEFQNRANKLPEQREIKRELVIERIHDVDVTHTTLTPAQVTAALALVSTLCLAYDLPMRVPMVGTDVRAGLMSDDELADWEGVLGHLHVSRGKVCPGLVVLRAVAAYPLRGRDGAAQ